MKFEHFDRSQFLAKYWQQQPVVLSQLIPEFEDIIDEHDLAGIAQESDADSRIVSRNDAGNWTTTNGPFEDFNTVCIDDWTLLVQGVERYIDSIDDLFELFAFVPYWRMDDVMVSYSTQGAGVGAHIDQYDVFLIQGKGQRRWQIGEPGNYPENDNNGLRQIKHFKPIIDVVTQQGDVIYIPPGWPHKGEAIENSLTYSIGFRAPDTEQLLNVMHELLETDANLNSRFGDPKRIYESHPAQVSSQDIGQLKSMLTALINHQDFDQHLLSHLSDCYVHDTDEQQSISVEDIKSALLVGCSIVRVEGIRPLYSEQQNTPNQFCFHIAGEVFYCDASIRPWIESILNNRNQALHVSREEPVDKLAATLSQLIHAGYYFIVS